MTRRTQFRVLLVAFPAKVHSGYVFTRFSRAISRRGPAGSSRQTPAPGRPDAAGAEADRRGRDLDGLRVTIVGDVLHSRVARSNVLLLSTLGAQVTNMILARLEIDFRAQVSVGDEVEVEVNPGRVGTKSFELDYTMRVHETVVAEAKSVLVAYDYRSEHSIEVPDAWREVLAA